MGLPAKIVSSVLICLSLILEGYAAEIPSDARPLVIRVGVYENPPKVFSATDGDVIGIYPDILKYIAGREGWKLEFVKGSWEECLQRLKENALDLLVDVAFSKQRAEQYDFNHETVFVNWGAIYTRKGFMANSFTDLENRIVAVMKSSIHTDGEQGIKTVLKQFDIPCTYVELDDYQAVFNALAEGRADVGVVNRLFGTLNENNSALIRSPIIFNPQHLKFAFPKNSALAPFLKERIDAWLKQLKENPSSIFHKTLSHYFSGLPGAFEDAAITGDKAKGIGSPSSSSSSLPLTEKEKAFLSTHPLIRVGIDPAYPPFEWRDLRGSHQGISADFIERIQERIGVTMEVVPGLSWLEVMAGARNRTLDVVACVSETPSRRAFLSFSQAYLSFPIVIITRTEAPFIAGLKDLGGKTVSVVKGYAPQEFIEKKHPTIKLSLPETPFDGLEQVATGASDAAVENLAVATYLMQKHHIGNLKVAAPADGIASTEFAMGIRSDWPELTQIINKALQSIPPEEQNAISGKWMSIRFEHVVNWWRVIQFTGAVAGGSALILLIFFYWNRKLRKEILFRKQIEMELQKATREAEKASKAKSIFLANMSHEIRTPMNAILGYSQLISQSPDLSDEQQSNIATIISSGEHLLHLINAVLEMSKIEAGRLEDNSTVFDLHTLLADMRLMFKIRTDEKQLLLEFSMAESVPRLVTGDEGKLRQVLINLLSNAVKFTDQGKVSLRVNKQAPYPGDKKHADNQILLVFEVADSGHGIPAKDLETIFTSFEQSDLGRAREGAGLGLAICREYIHFWGGEIGVESELGKGSLFRFTLPVIPAQVQGLPTHVDFPQIIGLAPAQPSQRILVVDDKETNREILVRMLKKMGFEVQTAVDGQEALTAFNAWHPHLILMDIRMPVMNGVEATRRIRASANGKDVVIIAVSASALEEERIDVLKYGADDFIRKPFKARVILETIKNHLNIEYMYASAPEKPVLEVSALSPEDIRTVPGELYVGIRRAIEGGYHEELLRLIAVIEENSPQVGKALFRLASDYEYNRLLSLFGSSASLPDGPVGDSDL